MSTSHILFRVVCLIGCLASFVSSTREDLTQELVGHIWRIPNPDKVLNDVLSRLERNREMTRNNQRYDQEEDCDESAEPLSEYPALGISRERQFRQSGSQKHYPICHQKRSIIKLSDKEYEYRPSYYEEILCTSAGDENKPYSREICSNLGFSCYQWNKTIHLTRRLHSSDCWESRTMVIPAGCECVWPIYRLGEMSFKRK